MICRTVTRKWAIWRVHPMPAPSTLVQLVAPGKRELFDSEEEAGTALAESRLVGQFVVQPVYEVVEENAQD